MVTLDGGARLARCPMPGTAERAKPRHDVVGTSLATAGVAAIGAWLIEGLALGWPLWAWLDLVLAPVSLDAFWHYEAYLVESGRKTLLDPSYFQRPLH